MSPAAPSAVEIAAGIVRGETSAVAVCRAALDRIAALDDRLHACQHVARERALARAEALDRVDAPIGPLHGVPIVVKDNFCVQGAPATAGSRILDGFVPPYDATAVARLERAGANVIAKTTMDEFAMGSSTEHSAFGPARNPWDETRAPGGSSGGSAVAVAVDYAPIGLGSDTGGSVRQPASFCGVVGLKPTYGRISRYGLIAFASSLDHVGPIGRTVKDVALALEIMSGHDPMDATSAVQPVPSFSTTLEGGLDGARIGVPRHLLADGVDGGVAQAFDAAVRTLVDQGARLVEVELPHTRHAIAVYYLIATAEASSNLARFDGVRYGRRAAADALADMYERTRGAGFGPEVKRRIMLGTYALSTGYYDAYYLKAQQVRTLIRRDYDRALASVDAIALPTSPVPAFRLGERTADPLQMYLADIFTVGADLAGTPAISVPCGFAAGGLPVGLQLIGRAWEEATVLRFAAAFERATDWTSRRPRP